MLVLPLDIPLLELFGIGRWGWGLGDLGNEVGGRGFGDAVDQDTHEGDFDDEEECKCKAVEHALAIVEPCSLLFGGVADAREVWFELWWVSAEDAQA